MSPRWSLGLVLWALAALAQGPAAAQTQQLENLLGGGNQPITIDADDSVEWRQDEKVYIARGNARAKRGDVTIAANVLRAHYRDGPEGQPDVWRFDAAGNVRIITPKERVYGDKGVYDVDTGVFELTGKNLRIEGEGRKLTARDKLEYRHKEQVARALGNAIATVEDKSLRADVLTAHFGEGADGKVRLQRAEATGNVSVSTPQEHARARRADYDAEKELLTLSGGVKLTRGANQLNGEYAEVNLKTGISRLLASPGGGAGGKPVRGLFVPREGEGEGGLGGLIPGAGGQAPAAGGATEKE